jgi:DNA repair protein RadD
MPTGTGKTKTTIEAVISWFQTLTASSKRATIFWMAHSDELCEQAIEQITELYEGKRHNHSLHLFRMWSSYTSKNIENKICEEIMGSVFMVEDGCSIVVTNPTNLLKIFALKDEFGWVHEMLRQSEVALIIDEAHRGLATTYKNAIEGLFAINPKSRLIGLTATPKRCSGTPNEQEQSAKLIELFGGQNRIIDPFQTSEQLLDYQVYDKFDKIFKTWADWESLPSDTVAKAYLVYRGILAKPRFVTVKTNFKLFMNDKVLHDFAKMEDLGPEDQEMLLEEIGERLDHYARREMVAGVVRQRASLRDGEQVLYFGPTVNDAEAMTWELRRRGIRASAIHGKVPTIIRRETIAGFKNEKIQALCNCNLLTTGFDHPKIRHLFVARPTFSTVLYEQMIGRALRGKEFGGTDECFIYNCVDEIIPGLVGLQFAWNKVEKAWDLALQLINEYSNYETENKVAA